MRCSKAVTALRALILTARDLLRKTVIAYGTQADFGSRQWLADCQYAISLSRALSLQDVMGKRLGFFASHLTRTKHVG